MKVLVVVFSLLYALVVSKSVNDEIGPKDNPAFGYLSRVGIPLAIKIREAEERAANTNITNVEDPSFKIINGERARLGQFPYQAGLLSGTTHGPGVCGGSLLTPNRVVTAAHCWWDGEKQAFGFTVVLGSLTLSYGGLRIDTNAVVMHRYWDPRIFVNDIAMIALPYNVEFSEIINPIALPPSGFFEETFVGETVVVSGFGRTYDGQQLGPQSVLSFTQLDIIPNQRCSRLYPQMRPSIICTAGVDYRSPCQGDSGGPLALFTENARYLVGVVSFGQKTCETGLPMGFSRVTAFRDWIVYHL